MDVCSTPKLELKLILETYVVITSFEESEIYVHDVSRGEAITLVAKVPRRLLISYSYDHVSVLI
jgi:hypothetical protein